MAIRVNPDQLQQNSRQINFVSNEITDVAKEIYAASTIKSGYPDFDGQIITICRSGRNQGIRQSEALSENSYDLQQRAEKFQKADTTSAERMSDAFAPIKPTIADVAAKMLEIQIEKQNMFTSEEFQKAWEDYGCPPEGSDAYLLFLLDHFTTPDDPVLIVKNAKDEYCVLIRGSDHEVYDPRSYFGDNLENSWYNNLPAWEGKRTGYEDTIISLIQEKVPPGKTVHLVGHSQGGIVANNCVADLMDIGYNVGSITNFGAPPPIYANIPALIPKTYYEAENDIVPKLTHIILSSQKAVAAAKLASDCANPLLFLSPDLRNEVNLLRDQINEINAILDRANNQMKKVKGYKTDRNDDITLDFIKFLMDPTHWISGQLLWKDLGVSFELLYENVFKAHECKDSYCADETIRNKQSSFEMDSSSLEFVAFADRKEEDKSKVRIDSTLEEQYQQSASHSGGGGHRF